MKAHCSTFVVIAAIGLAFNAFAQANQSQHPKPRHHMYRLVDLGTLGGPNGYFATEPIVKATNNSGAVVGAADTLAPDPAHPGFNLAHAYLWRRGTISDLGTLDGGQSSVAFWINDRGLIMGGSDDGLIDPVLGIAEQRSVIWRHGQIEDIGTLGVGVSFGNAMNNQGHIVGIAQNAVPDSFSFIGLPTETRAYLWEEGDQMRDLGTLGGPDAWAAFINERNQVVGFSYTDSTPNSTTGLPTQHPFLWENGVMTDLGTLGGTSAVVGSLQAPGGGAINNRRQVIGTSNLAGDLTHHPFLWERGRLKDLGTLGGANGEAYWINDSGDIVGRADRPNSASHHAFLWRNRRMTDLGADPNWPCSTAVDINAKGEIIIDTGICGVGGGPGSFSDNGEPLVDLNKLVIPGSGITVGDVAFINDLGEIAATGLLANGDQHSILLVPDRDCDDELEGAIEQSQIALFTSAARTPALGQTMPRIGAKSSPAYSLRDRLKRPVVPAQSAVPAN